jgi:hypothetical protein
MRKLTSTLFALLLLAPTHAQGKETAKIREAAEAALANQDWDTAIASFKQLVEADDKDAKAWLLLGYSLHAKGSLDEALKVHLRAAEFSEVAPIATYNVACVYSLQGKKDDALNWLTKAVKVGFNRPEHVQEDPDMEALRAEPRYKELLAQMEKNAATSPRVTVYAGSFDRKLARMVLFGGKGSLGGVSISYGQPRWNDSYEQHLASPKSENRRWRFGKDEWTTLDTSVPLTLGDQQLAAGVYYLTLERRGDQFLLAALDPTSVHAQTIDPYLAHQTKGGTEVAMKHETVDEVSKVLDIRLLETMGSPGAGELVIRFGPHKLSTKVALQVKGTDGGHGQNAK